MKSRILGNYLSQDEITLINIFIENSMKRFQTHDSRLRTTPKRLNTYELEELYIKKHHIWETAVKTKTPDNSSTYLSVLRKNEKIGRCPIEYFLKSLMRLIQQGSLPTKELDMIQILEKELQECAFLCPCPAETSW